MIFSLSEKWWFNTYFHETAKAFLSQKDVMKIRKLLASGCTSTKIVLDARDAENVFEKAGHVELTIQLKSCSEDGVSVQT